ncbi:MAG: hypothetical protein U1A77_10150 [Pirellulales bacterium]
MSPEFRSLLTKEWSERRSLFGWSLVVVAGFLGYCVAYEIEYRTRALISSYYSMCSLLMLPSVVLLSMSTANREYTRKTLKFTASLPVSLSRVAGARLLGMWICLTTPIVCGALLMTVLVGSGMFEQAGLRSDEIHRVSLPDRPSISPGEAVGFLWTTTAILLAVVLFHSTLVSLIGTYFRREGTVGFVGAIVMLVSAMATTIRPMLVTFGQYFASDWIGALLPTSLAISWGYSELDGSSYTDLEIAPLVFGPIALNLMLTAGLAIGFTRRYGRRAETLAEAIAPRRRWWLRWRWPSVIARLGIPWPGRFAALTWLNGRQAVPLSFAGLTIAVLITTLGELESLSRGHALRIAQGDSLATQVLGQLPSTTWFLGMLWSAIVGVAIFSGELQPKLEQFWRSRPIAPGNWFWMKFAIGLFAVVGLFDLLPAALLAVVGTRTNPGQPGTSVFAYLACMPLMHALVYSLAVAAVCRLKRSIPAAIVALVAFFILDAVPKSIPGCGELSTIDVFNRLDGANRERSDLLDSGYPIVYGTVLALIMGAIFLAWRTLRGPRMPRAVTWAILVVVGLFCGLPTTYAADSPTVAEILDGIRQRESLQQNMRLRFLLKSTSSTQPASALAASRRRRPNRSASQQPVMTESVFELMEQLPRRAWTETGPDGTIRSLTAFDGKVQVNYSESRRTLSSRSLATSTPQPTFLRPDEALMNIGGTRLTELMGQSAGAALISLSVREDAGEQLVEFTLIRRLPAGHYPPSAAERAGEPATEAELRSHITVNASRHYWPVKIIDEARLRPSGQLESRIETTATGWIDAGPCSFPRHVQQKWFLDSRLPDASHDSRADASSTLPLVSTVEMETLEVAMNTTLPDSAFTARPPAGTVILDSRDNKNYEVLADGSEQLYVSRPKGLRGAVFTYHLLWITAAIAAFLRRTRASQEG